MFIIDHCSVDIIFVVVGDDGVQDNTDIIKYVNVSLSMTYTVLHYTRHVLMYLTYGYSSIMTAPFSLLQVFLQHNLLHSEQQFDQCLCQYTSKLNHLWAILKLQRLNWSS